MILLSSWYITELILTILSDFVAHSNDISGALNIMVESVAGVGENLHTL